MTMFLGKKSQAIFHIAIFAFLCLSHSNVVMGEEKSAGESKKVKKCEKPKHFAQDLDYDWVMGQSKWYFPMMNREELLRQSSDILQETLEELASSGKKPTELKSKACFQAVWEGLSPAISGFNGKRVSYDLSPSDWTNFNILGFEKAWKSGQAGTLYITHTDNQNFVFLVRCWEDGTRTWSVMTTDKHPKKAARKAILDHVKLLGFDEDDLELLDYDQCGSGSSGKTEL